MGETMTLKGHWAVRPLAPVAVQVTVVMPMAKVEPEAGEQTTVATLGTAVGFV